MPGLGPCADKSPLSKEEKDYLHSQAALHRKNGLDATAADRKAVMDFRHKTQDALADLYKQIGIDGYATKEPVKEVETKEEKPAAVNKEKPVKEIRIRKKPKLSAARQKAADIEDLATDPRSIALLHLVTGGTVNSKSILKLLGSDAEVNRRIQYRRADGKTIDQLAHDMWEASKSTKPIDDDSPDQFTTEDFQNALEDVVRTHISPESAAKELIDSFEKNNVQSELTRTESNQTEDWSGIESWKPKNEHADENPLVSTIHADVKALPEDTKAELEKALSKYTDDKGQVDWEKLGEDLNGFEPELLNLSEKTLKDLHATIDKRAAEIKSNDDQSDNVGDKDGSGKSKKEENGGGRADNSERGSGTKAERLTAAKAEYDRATRELKKAEDKIGKTQSTQLGIGETKQGGMFGMQRDEAKGILDPLRAKVKEAKAAIDKISAEPEPTAKNQTGLFPLIGGDKSTGNKVVNAEDYSTPLKAIETIRKAHPDNVLLNRAMDFLEPILKANPKIRLENTPDLHLEGNKVRGVTHPNGKVEVDFDAHASAESAHRTVIHELLHAATNAELDKKGEFYNEVRGLLEDIRRKTPGFTEAAGTGAVADIVTPNMVMASRFGRDLYGLSNEHELLSELFSNQEFRDRLANMKAPESTPEKPLNMLQKVFRAIAKAFDSKYGRVGDVKSKISANDMAEHLMQLTEGVIKAKDNYRKKESGKSLASIEAGSSQMDKIRDWVNKKSEFMSEDEMRDALGKNTKLSADEIDKLFDNKNNIHQAAMSVPFAKEFMEHDVKPFLGTLGATVKDALHRIVAAVSPRSLASEKAVTTIMGALGDRNESMAAVDKALDGMEKMFDRLKDADRIAFIDRIKRGLPQPTPDMQDIADAIRTLDTNLYNEIKKFNPSQAWKDDHFRVLWKDFPSANKTKTWSLLAKRPLEGSRGFMKMATLTDMSEGIAKGGVPQTTNPIRMFKLAYADGMKYITAQNMFEGLKKNGMVQFEKIGHPPPDGFVRLNDRLSKVYFRGEYYVDEGAARLLNNHLSVDHIRGSQVGKGFMELKNLYTAAELGLSGFHAVAEGLEAISSQVGVGLRKMINLGLRGNLGAVGSGLKDIITSPLAPGTTFKTGRSAQKLALEKDWETTGPGAAFLKRMPAAKEYLHDFFQGGGLLKQHDDLRSNTMAALKEHAGKDNYIGAALRAVPALNEMVLSPLFNHYIPALKTGMFFKEFPLLLEENKGRLAKGQVTREQLSRQAVDFIDDRIGEMNFDNLFWDNDFKTSSQFMLRSVTWKMGNLRAMVGAIPEQAMEFIHAAKEGRAPNLMPKAAWLVGLSIMQVTLATTIQKLLANKDIKSFKDIVAPQIDEHDETQRVILPTYYKDMLHLAHSPYEYATTSASGPLGKWIDIIKNKDFYNQEIYDPHDNFLQRQKEKLQYFIPKPFSITSALQQHAEGQGAGKMAMSFLGLNKAPGYLTHTPIENDIFDLYNVRNAGSKPYKEKAANDAKRIVTNLYRNGDIPAAQRKADDFVDKGVLVPKQVNALLHRAGDNDNPSVYFFKRLPDEDKEYLYSQMTKEEKELYDPKGKVRILVENAKK